MNLADIRNDYTRGKLERADLDRDPIVQFNRWFKDACDAGIIEPTGMSLATCGADGRPSLRTVLLKGLDERGFVFFTNLESRKARQLAENGHAALLFPWLLLERQVIVIGSVEKLGTGEVVKYFLTRPRESQLAAWASQQSRVIESRKILEMEWAKMKAKFGAGQVPLPSFWGGFRVKPESIEFWQGRASRLHDRFEYRPAGGGGWEIERLAP